MIFDFLEKILFMSVGIIFGFTIGLIFGILGFGVFWEVDNPIRYILLFMVVAGGISLFVLLRKDNKIEGIKKWVKN